MTLSEKIAAFEQASIAMEEPLTELNEALVAQGVKIGFHSYLVGNQLYQAYLTPDNRLYLVRKMTPPIYVLEDV